MIAVSPRPSYLRQRARLLALFLQLATFYGVFVWVRGGWTISSGGEALWILAAAEWGALSLLGAPWYRPPRDAFAVALTTLATLIPLDLSTAPHLTQQVTILRSVSIWFCVALLMAASTAMVIEYGGKWEQARRIVHSLADRFSGGPFVFGMVALISIFGFYENEGTRLWLVALWFGFALSKPFEWLLLLFTRLGMARATLDAPPLIGRVRRVDHPDIVRFALEPGVSWDGKGAYIAALPGGRVHYLLPIGLQVQNDEVIATALCCGSPSAIVDIEPGGVISVEDAGERQALVNGVCQTTDDSEIVGITVQGSEIASIQFEVLVDEGLREGSLVCCTIAGTCVYYQVLGARTAEESFESSPRGLQIAEAVQLGSLTARGFEKYPWLPAMNLPVYSKTKLANPQPVAPPGTITLGKLPDSELEVRLSLGSLIEYHCAVLGVTGTGKTEVSLDLARAALADGAKVVCVDLTGEYENRLADIEAETMGVPADKVEEFDLAIFETDVGGFSKSKEKVDLEERFRKLQTKIDARVDAFLERKDVSLAHFTFSDVVNTKASLRITEMFLSSIMRWARNNRKRRRIMIVLEEAHTIIPEVSGAQDKDSQRVVMRIGQIALQGRKYGVGLLVVSQRTALVSKTILSQCHTFLIHSLIDQTSLDFLQNVIGREYIKVIPNLMPLQLIAAGKAVHSERPTLTQREWSEQKAAASEALNRTDMSEAPQFDAGEVISATLDDPDSFVMEAAPEPDAIVTEAGFEGHEDGVGGNDGNESSVAE
ncbi:ATP-binding protein [Sphingomonas asaccharolytica]|uniref:ATP-binding protein n=1 Tax=Sphingomonas asaccharolytica TaxID=40681 RepID=UPI00082E58AF|nr:ATP-binding protein [Sphingomonas asaccharolytica]